MVIRKITYSIGYVHVLTFKENYKSIITPYFDFEPLEYAIDNENTISESIRLIFRNEGFILLFRKEGITFIYEGNVNDIKKNNPIIDIFFEIYEKIKKIEGFSKTKRHEINIDAVGIVEKEKSELLLERNLYLTNPFGKLREFATIFEFERDLKKYRLQFGNFSEDDIKKYNLSPLNTEHNSDLKGNFGLMCQVTVKEDITSSSFNKFKQLLKDGEGVINLYLEKIV